MNNAERERKARERDEKYLVVNPITGKLQFDRKRAWYDSVAKCNKSQAREVNRSLKVLGMNQTMTRVDINKLIEVYDQKRLDPEYGPEIWTIAGMFSGSPPTSEDMRSQLGMIKRKKFQERMIEKSKQAEGNQWIGDGGIQ